MILTSREIRELNLVYPCLDQGRHRGMSYGLTQAGYDLRGVASGGSACVNGARLCSGMGDAPAIFLPPGGGVLMTTIESITLPADVIGFLHPKSTWTRRFVITHAAVLEPGWYGHPTVLMQNLGAHHVTITNYDPIVRVVFDRLGESEIPHDGRYQGADGVQGAIHD